MILFVLNLCFFSCLEAVTTDIRWGFQTPLPYTNQMLCGTSGIAGENVDACQGDSGGPLAREVICCLGRVVLPEEKRYCTFPFFAISNQKCS